MPTPLFESLSKIEINVRLLATGETFTLEVSPSGNILEIKCKVQKEKGNDSSIPVEDQTVYFAGKPRVDERCFKDCGIQVGSYISILVKTPAPHRRPLPPRPTLPKKTQATLELPNEVNDRSALYRLAAGKKEPGVEDGNVDEVRQTRLSN